MAKLESLKVSFDCCWWILVVLSLLNFAHLVKGNDCLDVFISVDIDDICYFNQSWNISWTVESFQNESKQVRGTQNGVTCDLTFSYNDCLQITVQYVNYSWWDDPLTSVVFLYDSYQIFRFTPHNWSTNYFYDYDYVLTLNDTTNEMTIRYSDCANETDIYDTTYVPFTTDAPTLAPTYECLDWPQYVCNLYVFVYFFEFCDRRAYRAKRKNKNSKVYKRKTTQK